MRTFSLTLLALLAGGQALFAQDGVAVWPDAKLKGFDAELAPKVNEEHFAIERLGDFGNHYVLAVHRTASGPAETHAGETDFYVVQKGSGTLHVGGELVDAHEVSPGEVRAKSVKGGKTYKLKPGDTVNIPPKTAHQVALADGETITYLIVKVKAQQ